MRFFSSSKERGGGMQNFVMITDSIHGEKTGIYCIPKSLKVR